jgi:hypothetical protein
MILSLDNAAKQGRTQQHVLGIKEWSLINLDMSPALKADLTVGPARKNPARKILDIALDGLLDSHTIVMTSNINPLRRVFYCQNQGLGQVNLVG